MSKIDIENSKPIRKAMDVICGLETKSGLKPFVYSANSYDNVNGDITGLPVYTQYMDLSGDGFPNDGSALPLTAEHSGVVASISSSGISKLEIYVKFEGSTSDTDTQIVEATAYYYVKGKLKRQKITIGSSWQSITYRFVINSTDGRIQLAKIVPGYSWWFDNASLISCNVALRSVETKVDNPELQISEIEITGYEKNDILEEISLIGDDAPITYSCGYPGDMSEPRTFYLSQAISWEDNQIIIKGEDATKFLAAEYSGKFIGNYTGAGGGIGKYIETIHEMLNNAGISHEYENYYMAGPYSDGEPAFIKNISKRDIIAQAVNLFNFKSDWLGECGLVYVDAGRPRLIAKPRIKPDAYDINGYSELKTETNRKIKRVEINNPYVDRGPSKNIETIDAEGTIIRSASDPLLSVATSTGTVSLITPYKYKLKASGSATVTGRAVRFYDPTDNDSVTPRVLNRASGVETLTLNEFNGMVDGAVAPTGDGYLTDFWYYALRQIMDRPLKIFTFTWRGDPRLQPRDYIRLTINDTPVDMTIESITLNHEGGGLTSQIVAREGLI